jgi:hypothetical protein
MSMLLMADTNEYEKLTKQKLLSQNYLEEILCQLHYIRDKSHAISPGIELGFLLQRYKTNEMHIQSRANHIFRIPKLLLHVSALYERHLQVLSTDNTQTVSTLYRLTSHRRYPLSTD